MKSKIVVVGGYGHVGRGICKRLAPMFPGLVYAAGRSMAKAQAAYCDQGATSFKPMELDAGQAAKGDWLDEVKLIVMCLD